MYVIHVFSVYLFYFGVLLLIYKNFEIARFCIDSVIGYAKLLVGLSEAS